MAKLIIYVSGRTNVHGYRRRNFIFLPQFDKFVYDGREIDEKEFNEIVDKVMSQNDSLNPRVMISTPSAAAPSFIPPDAPKTKDEAIQVAVDILETYAPHRLSKPPSAADLARDSAPPADAVVAPPPAPVAPPPAPPTPRNLRGAQPAKTANRIDV